MKNCSSFNNLFSRDRKVLYIILGIVMISVLTLTVVYAALSTTLNINGNAEVSSASWDIHLDNVQLNSSSATTVAPTITDSRTATFSTTLTNPGDFYEFTIDVVNDGDIDAMIDSVTKTPELSDTQKKYLNYIVEYQNGESITSKQLVSKNSFVRLKVKLEFRKDITASDLPTQSETLNLAFTVNYVQSDDSKENIMIDNNGKLIKVVSGDYDTVGSEICIGEECFYVISNDGDSVTMLAKYNLYVGGNYESGNWIKYDDEATGIQDSTMLGWILGQTVNKGTTLFSLTNYWSSTVSSYPEYVYDSNSNIYDYVENYKTYLENQGAEIEEARLIKLEELETLGCNRTSGSCKNAPLWVYSTSYWTGIAHIDDYVWDVSSGGYLSDNIFSHSFDSGVRPVITIEISKF